MNATATVTNGESEACERSDTGPVWVQCPGFRCLAYLDEDGKWRTFFNSEVLPATVIVIDLNNETF